jgi:cytochrome c oxidase subunit 2
VIAGGKEQTVVTDETYLRRSILEPNAEIVKGYPSIMPVQQFTEEEIKGLVDHIKQLK